MQAKFRGALSVCRRRLRRSAPVAIELRLHPELERGFAVLSLARPFAVHDYLAKNGPFSRSVRPPGLPDTEHRPRRWIQSAPDLLHRLYPGWT